jgi:hypothetical protein
LVVAVRVVYFQRQEPRVLIQLLAPLHLQVVEGLFLLTTGILVVLALVALVIALLEIQVAQETHPLLPHLRGIMVAMALLAEVEVGVAQVQ